jgi:hypothetical protein
MGRGQRTDQMRDGPRRGFRWPQTALVRANWRELHALGHALVLIPEPAPIPSDRDRIVLRCWRARRVAGAWEPDEELDVIRLSRPLSA